MQTKVTEIFIKHFNEHMQEVLDDINYEIALLRDELEDIYDGHSDSNEADIMQALANHEQAYKMAKVFWDNAKIPQ